MATTNKISMGKAYNQLNFEKTFKCMSWSWPVLIQGIQANVIIK